MSQRTNPSTNTLMLLASSSMWVLLEKVG
jgi:hypothetical protein